MEKGEVTFTYSGVLTRNNRKLIRVRFERKGNSGIDFAEGKIPECKIEKQNGFSQEEIRQMEEYLEIEKENIIREAKKLNNIKNLLS
jgi:hypothetical protein